MHAFQNVRHIVNRSCDSASTHTSRVATGDSNEDGVDVRHRKRQHGEGVIGPWTASGGESNEGCETWDNLNLADCGKQEALVQLFREPSPEQEANDEEYECWDYEKVCSESVEADFSLQREAG